MKKGTYLADERRKGRVTVAQTVLTGVLERAFFDPRRDDEGRYAIQVFLKVQLERKVDGMRLGRTGDQVCQRKMYSSSHLALVLCRSAHRLEGRQRVETRGPHIPVPI